ncbi:MAG: NAD(P)/FAD-dependent oxidoreductase, partial [Thermoplasmata archaeon]|nr:NAD(P)/FAD-dependent oxidoreductase [Thermoplasmata archaeon]
MNVRECDVLVVGAGPAGSVSAKFAAQNGADVLMIEKRPEIGSPVRCGEGVSKRWQEKVGIRIDRRWVAREISAASIYSPDGTRLVIDAEKAGNEVGMVLERDLFDKALAEDAAKAGADIMLRTAAVDVIREGERIVGVKAKSMGETLTIKAKG